MKQSKNLSQKTAEEIMRKINEGCFVPGERLPGENELSAAFNVSRGTLRESIRMLAAEGVLRSERGKGTFVVEGFKPYGEYAAGGLARQKMRLQDLFDARLMFEPETAAMACRRASDGEMRKIIKLGEQVQAAIMDGRDRTVPDQAFHNAIIAASHNEFLMHLIPVINSAIAEAVDLKGIKGLLAEETLRDHALLMGFMKARDAEGARNAMSVHLRHALLSLQQDGDTESSV